MSQRRRHPAATACSRTASIKARPIPRPTSVLMMATTSHSLFTTSYMSRPTSRPRWQRSRVGWRHRSGHPCGPRCRLRTHPPTDGLPRAGRRVLCSVYGSWPDGSRRLDRAMLLDAHPSSDSFNEKALDLPWSLEPISRRAGHRCPAAKISMRFTRQSASLVIGPACVGVSRVSDVPGQSGGRGVIVGAEPLVAHVHFGQAAVDLVCALVEPPADVLAVRLGGGHRLLAIRCQACREGRGEAGSHLFLLGLELLPVLLLVGCDAALRLPVGFGLAPALLCLLGVVLGTELTEDLEALLRRQPYIHGLCLHFVVDGVDHRAQPFDPLG